jgi:hypothetical protein
MPNSEVVSELGMVRGLEPLRADKLPRYFLQRQHVGSLPASTVSFLPDLFATNLSTAWVGRMELLSTRRSDATLCAFDRSVHVYDSEDQHVVEEVN